jgi:hypothetical protein
MNFLSFSEKKVDIDDGYRLGERVGVVFFYGFLKISENWHLYRVWRLLAVKVRTATQIFQHC